MSRSRTQVVARPHFEDILPITGWGVYYKFMISMACIASFAQAMAFFALPFAIALSTCDHTITEDLIMDLHICFVIGRSLCGLMFTAMCDIYGRKRLLTYSMLFIFLGCFMSAFAYNYYVVILSSIILGSGLEANYCVVRVHLAEVLPSKKRGVILALCDVCWGVGYIVISLLGILLKHTPMPEQNIVDMRLAYWRMIFAIAGGLNIAMACATALLEESPRFFLHIKKNFLAVLTLKQFYAINKSSYGDSLQVKESDVANIVNQNYPAIYPEPHGCINIFEKVAKIFSWSLKELFSESYRKTTLILLFIKLPLLILGHLEVNNTLSKHTYHINGFPQDGTHILYVDGLKNMTLCNVKGNNEFLYYIYFILTACVLLGILTAAGLLDFMGRNVLSSASLTLCASGYFALFWIRNTTAKTIISTVLMASFSTAITTFSVINIESYPTALRCTSWAFTNFPALILSHFCIRYYHYFADNFFLFHGCLFFGAAIASCFLRDLKGKPMVE